jgi:hypothetical protein
LPLDLYRVVVIERLLLALSGARRGDGGHLLLRVDFHQQLSRLHVIP